MGPQRFAELDELGGVVNSRQKAENETLLATEVTLVGRGEGEGVPR